MFLLEILVIIVILAFVANGARAGAVETLGRLLGSILGFLAAKAYSGWLIGLLALFIPLNWAYLAAFLFIFLLVDHLVGWIFKLAQTITRVFTRLPILKQLDGLLGLVFGFFEAVIVIGGVSWLLKQAALTQSGLTLFTNLKTAKLIDAAFRFLLAFLL